MSKPTPPDPNSVEFDLAHALDSVVALHSRIPEDGLTAQVLGTERAGHGVVIDERGLVLTIGYLIAEADSVWLVDNKGVTAPGYVLAYDQESGFGLVQPLQSVSWPHLELGSSADLAARDRVIVAGHGGLSEAIDARIIAKREFAGYWEYVLDEAIFTAPAHPNWGGAAMIGMDGKLYGIGSLLVQQSTDGETSSGANMIVPIDVLKPIAEELKLYGRPNRPPRPWIGWLVQEVGEYLAVAGVHDDCPADKAGVMVGDVILEVAGEPAGDLADLFRRIWDLGEAGVEVPVTVLRNDETHNVIIESVDRNARMKSGSVH